MSSWVNSPPSPSALPFVRPEQCRAKYVHKQLVTLHFQVDFRALVSIVALLSYDHTSTTGNLKLIQGIRNLRRVVNSPSERFKQTSGASETHRRVSKPSTSSEHIQKPANLCKLLLSFTRTLFSRHGIFNSDVCY